MSIPLVFGEDTKLDLEVNCLHCPISSVFLDYPDGKVATFGGLLRYK